MLKFQGSIKSEVDFSTRLIKKKSCGISVVGLGYLTLEFPRGESRKHVFSGISKGKVTNLKIPGLFSNLLFRFFLE